MAIAFGQRVEKTILLPDALSGMVGPYGIAHDSAHNQVYIGGRFGNCVIALSGTTYQRIARIPAGIGVGALLLVPRHNKLYCANAGEVGEPDSTVTVINSLTNAPVSTLHVGRYPSALCYNTANDRIYVANKGYLPSQPDSTVTVVDCGADSILAQVTVGVQPTALCYAPTNNRIYVACQEAALLVVVDGSTNQVVKSLFVGVQPRALCYSAEGNKVYVACFDDDAVAVIDCSNDSLIRSIDVGDGPRSLCLDAVDNKVYCADSRSRTVTVLDAAADTVVAVIPAGRGASAVCWLRSTNKVYCATSSNRVGVIDCARDSLLAWVETNTVMTTAVGTDPLNSKAYATDWGGWSVAVIDGSTDSVISKVCMGVAGWTMLADARGDRYVQYQTPPPALLVRDVHTDSALSTTALRTAAAGFCHAARENRVFVRSSSVDSVSVYDCARESIVAVVPVGRGTGEMCYSQASGRVYCLNRTDSTLTVIDAASNQVRATLPVGADPRALCYAPDIDRVVCANYGADDLTVIDCAGDRVVARIPAGDGPSVMCYSPGRKVVYCGSERTASLVVVDCSTNQALDTMVFGQVSHLCYNPHDQKAYASCSQTMFVIDATSDTVLATLLLGPWAGELCYIPEQNHVYCVGRSAHVVHVVDGTNDRVVASVPVEVTANYLYPIGQTRRVYVAGPARYTVIRTDLPGIQAGPVRRADGRQPQLEATPTAMRWSTNVKLHVPSPGRVRLTVVDAAGRVVRELACAELGPGTYVYRWNGRNARGQRVTAGVYLLRAETRQGASLSKVVLIGS